MFNELTSVSHASHESPGRRQHASHSRLYCRIQASGARARSGNGLSSVAALESFRPVSIDCQVRETSVRIIRQSEGGYVRMSCLSMRVCAGS